MVGALVVAIIGGVETMGDGGSGTEAVSLLVVLLLTGD